MVVLLGPLALVVLAIPSLFMGVRPRPHLDSGRPRPRHLAVVVQVLEGQWDACRGGTHPGHQIGKSGGRGGTYHGGGGGRRRPRRRPSSPTRPSFSASLSVIVRVVPCASISSILAVTLITLPVIKVIYISTHLVCSPGSLAAASPLYLWLGVSKVEIKNKTYMHMY